MTRSATTNDSQILETRTIRAGRGKSFRGGRGTLSNKGARSTSMVAGTGNVPGKFTRQTRSAEPQAVQQPGVAQPLQQPRQRAAPQLLPPRIPSQRILQKRLSAPLTGPGSSVDNEIILD